MTRRLFTMSLVAFAATQAWTAHPALAQTFDLSWHTIDGGGVLFSSGGTLQLSGTIGQPDAGVMAGGTFVVEGGFWNAGLNAAPVPGDGDGDGDVDQDDLDLVLFNFGTSGWPPNTNGDVDGDGDVDQDDLDLVLFNFGT